MRRASILIFVIISGTTINASAAEFEYEVRAGWGRSDNIVRTAANERDEEFALVDLRFNGGHQTRKVDFGVDADVGFRHYSSDVFDDDVVGAFNAHLDFGFIPGVFTWRSSNNFGQLQSDPFRPSTPDNQQNVNNFSTGPDLHIQFGPATALDAGAHYRTNTFESSNIDNDVLGGELALVRALSKNRRVSLNLSADRVEYDSASPGGGFDRQSAYVSLFSQVPRGSITVDVGINEVHDDGVTVDGFLGSVSVERALSTKNQLTLSYDQRLSDAGDIFRRFQDPGRQFGEPRDITGTASPFENKRLRLRLDHDRVTSNWYWSVDFNEEDYVQESSLNRRRISLGAGMSKRFGAGWRMRVDGRLQRSDLYSTGRDDDDAVLRLGLSKQLSRKVDVDVSFEHADRQSNDPLAEYRDNRMAITFGYSGG